MTETPGRSVPVAASGSAPAPPASADDAPLTNDSTGEPAVPAGPGGPADMPTPDTAGEVPDLGTRTNGPDTGPIVIAEERSDLSGILARRAAEGTSCPRCGDRRPAQADLTCPACGARRPVARDHVELRVGLAAGVTDRGLRRRRNEDALAMGRRRTPGGELLVGIVCDGVASARRGDEASLAAAEAAVEAALAAADRDPATGELPDLDTIAAAAADAADHAATELGRAVESTDPPACTYVGVIVRAGSAVVSWVGDSRVYWLAGDGSSQQLTTDDSWAEEIAAAGLIPREQVHTDRRAHVLTRWLGLDSPSGPARSRRVRVTVPGALMLCSDGLWNHIPEPEELTRRVRGRDAAADATALVDAAIADGGHDNVTVVVLPVAPADEADAALEIDGRGPEEATGPIPIPGGQA